MAPPPRRRAPAGDGRRGPADPRIAAAEPEINPTTRELAQIADRATRSRATADDRSSLLARAAAGDRAAEERLFNENLDLVLRLARSRAGQEPPDGLTEEELIQEGSLGLVSAIQNFPGGGADFAAMVGDRVEGQMAAASAARQREIAADAQLVSDAEAYERAEVSVRRSKGRAATPAELAEKLEWSVEKTVQLGTMVLEARRQHDEELLAYLEPDDISTIELEPLTDDPPRA